MGTAFTSSVVHAAARAALICVALLFPGCASLRPVGHDSLTIENEAGEYIDVAIDYGPHMVHIGRVAPQSRRTLVVWKGHVPGGFTHAYLRVVPAVASPLRLAYAERTARTFSKLFSHEAMGRIFWRFTGTDLIHARR